jgi:6,7-dimethyl-8-ribityllumazine synthase
MIFEITSRGFERVIFEEDTPLIIEMLPVTSIDQVKARCGDDDSNKGIEAAIAAAKVIEFRKF